MVQTAFAVASAPKTRVSQYVLRERIIRHFRILQSHLHSLPDNKDGQIANVAFGTDQTNANYEATTSGDLEFRIEFPQLPEQFKLNNDDKDAYSVLILHCTFEPRKPPVLEFDRTDRPHSDGMSLMVDMTGPISMVPIRAQIDSFVTGQIARLENVPSAKAFLDAYQKTAKAPAPRPAP